jgi:hypothetical protein
MDTASPRVEQSTQLTLANRRVGWVFKAEYTGSLPSVLATFKQHRVERGKWRASLTVSRKRPLVEDKSELAEFDLAIHKGSGGMCPALNSKQLSSLNSHECRAIGTMELRGWAGGQ